MIPYWIELSPIVRAFGALFFAFTLTLLVGPYFIKKLYELKIGQPIRDFTEFKFLLADLHKNKKNTPTMGGILIIFTTLVSVLLWADLRDPFTWFLIAGMVVMGILGGIDDASKLKNKSFRGISGRMRLFVQFLFGAVVLYYFSDNRLYVPFIKEPFFIPLLAVIVLDLIVISGTCNGVNLTDGLDGLATGCAILVLFVLALAGLNEVSVFLAATIGALLGFLWFNCYPAQVFMGDTGSLAIGAVIGVAAVLLKKEILLGLVGALFALETVSVMLQVLSFRLFKKRIFLCAPLHHHFEYAGVPETKVVMRFWIVGILLALVGISSLYYPN